MESSIVVRLLLSKECLFFVEKEEQQKIIRELTTLIYSFFGGPEIENEELKHIPDEQEICGGFLCGLNILCDCDYLVSNRRVKHCSVYIPPSRINIVWGFCANNDAPNLSLKVEVSLAKKDKIRKKTQKLLRDLLSFYFVGVQSRLEYFPTSKEVVLTTKSVG